MDFFKSCRIFLLLSGLLMTLLGIVVIFTPYESLVALTLILGLLLLFSGLSEILIFIDQGKDERSGWWLAGGILSLIIGIWILFGRGSDALLAFIPTVFAVWVLFSGILRVVGSLSLRSYGVKYWWLSTILGLLYSIAGFALLFMPLLSSMLVVYTIAISLILYGITNVVIYWNLRKIVKALE
ncbi:MAG: DUF308 domain-containing protein [Methanimicrococcus sp.]|nr:DUF308 domain-containing protein [Methanimicrococcus sp.]